MYVLCVALVQITMSATSVLSSAKRKRTKPHKLGEKKRTFSRGDSDEDAVPVSETQRVCNEDYQRDQEYPPAHAAKESTSHRRRPKGSKDKPLTSVMAARARDEEDESKQECATAHPDEASTPQKYPDTHEGAPRSRGRPKGSKNKTFSGSHEIVFRARNEQDHKSSHVTSISKSEHPNGGDISHRGRGRPKGSTKKIYPASLQVSGKSSGDDAPKRSRGRPKGSPNKKPSKAALMLKYGIPKLGRGRPKKLLATNGAVTPKRGRGRPKGAVKKTPSTTKVKVAHVTGGSGLKKRGRPKKSDSAHSANLTHKRPRGRPKLVVKPVAVSNSEEEDSGSCMGNDDTASGNEDSP
ncbi:origin recognition complex subunit 4-like [Pelobates cultripes]|uniref:Origin recognition complex subunit 4-like n=1 Tax=Pelobates cultripes TaxID=61616 RepID=A0AAD1SXX6_PELCU|nr:origin recognition complex subunit 4-like [Pelobates cultripes]